MSENVTYVNVAPEKMGQIFEQLGEAEKNTRTTVLTKPFLTHTYAPAERGKYKGLHRLKFEVLIPEEAISGPNALLDVGAFLALKVPTNRIADEFLKEDQK